MLNRFSYRQSQRGANLALIAVSLATLIGMMGVGIYAGVQAYVKGELQKAATTAAMAGAAVYMQGGTPNPGNAVSTAKDVYNKVYNATPALKSFGVKLNGVTTNAGAHTVTVAMSGEIPTPFMALVGVNKINVDATGSAKALRYVPTGLAGGVILAPPSVPTADMILEFPLIDNPTPGSIEMVTRSGVAGDGLRGYMVSACNSSTCYDIMGVAQGNVKQTKNGPACFGTCSFDIGAAGVNKATSIHFVDDGVYNVFINGVTQLDSRPAGPVIHSVELYGYSGSCVNATKCAIPNGFASY